jgi:hypothetical protein
VTEDRFETEIAKAESTMLGVEDHGILTCMIHMKVGGGGQGAGGYAFDGPVKGTSLEDKYDDGTYSRRVGSAFGMEFIRRLLLAFGVDEWEQIPGRTVFVLRNKGDSWGPIKGFRPLPTENGYEFVFSDLDVLVEKVPSAA